MDGPVHIGGRSLTIDFEVDRHSQHRLQAAYRLIEPPLARSIVLYKLPRKPGGMSPHSHWRFMDEPS